MTITMSDYSAIKREVEKELEKTGDEIRKLFDGVMFNQEAYRSFTTDERRLYSALRQLKENLEGQLDAFKRLEGDECTMFDGLLRWKNKLIEDMEE